MQEERLSTIQIALNAALSGPLEYESLWQESDAFWSILSDNSMMRTHFPQLSQEQRGHVAMTVLQAVDAAIYDIDQKIPNRIPEATISVVRHAIELILEAGPTGRGQKAYRNRHFKFLSSFAQLAEAASGGNDENADFYQNLGRQIAHFVLDENLPEFAATGIAPSEWQHGGIRSAAMEKVVYFVGAESGPVKIGVAANPKERLANLQTAHFEKLTLLALASGGSDAERKYHERFAAHRLQGEWFIRHDEIIEEISHLNSMPKPSFEQRREI